MFLIVFWCFYAFNETFERTDMTDRDRSDRDRKTNRQERKSQRKVCETIFVGLLRELFGIDLTDRFDIDRFGDGRVEAGKEGIGGMDAMEASMLGGADGKLFCWLTCLGSLCSNLACINFESSSSSMSVRGFILILFVFFLREDFLGFLMVTSSTSESLL
jgi:hypothetical protein